MVFENLEDANKAYKELEENFKKSEAERVSLDNVSKNYETQINDLKGTMEELRQANMHLWKSVPREGIKQPLVPEEPKQEVPKAIDWNDFMSDF